MLRPVGGALPRLQALFELSVHPLHHAVALGVAGSGVDVVDPSIVHRLAQRVEVNWLPWSKVMVAGMLNLAAIWLIRAST